MKAHLLYPRQDFDFSAGGPTNQNDLIQDLELMTVLNAMARGDPFLFDIATKVIMASLDDPEAIRYRQAVLADAIAHPDVVRQMYTVATRALKDKRGLWWHGSQSPTSIRTGAVECLDLFVIRLLELRKLADEHALSFDSVGMSTLCRTLQEDLDGDYFQTIEHHLKQVRFRDGEILSAKLGKDNSGIDFVLRTPRSSKTRWKERFGIAPRTSYSLTLAPRDEAGAQYLGDLTNRGLNLVANALAQAADHITSYFTMLRAELGFYVGCLNLHEYLVGKNVSTTFPSPAPWSPPRLSFVGLRETALAIRSTGQVVPNEVDMRDISLTIITGANSGGKSTFLRSVGQAQFMMQCGLFVAAESFEASVCEAIYTHFIREEDAQMNHGRLDDELSRMSAIADHLRHRCFVLFNESFAATNEREGSEIGRQVVSALLESDVRVFFVTHQYDFAESFEVRQEKSTLFLRAERDDQGKRSYRLVQAGPLPTSYGEDIYYRLGGWLGEAEESAGVAEESALEYRPMNRRAV